jgi:hypothetical protein
MAFTSIEELKAAVEERRKAILTLEVDLGGPYSQEHEDAKKDLATAKGLKSLAGGQGFMNDNIEGLEARVAETKPESQSVWIQYRRIPLDEWSLLMKDKTGMSALEQYEKVLPKVFVGVYGTDPVEPDELEEGQVWEAPEPLSTDGALVSSKGVQGILPGGGLNPVVQSFMAWQNSGGDVNIRPTKSGRD